MAVDMFLKIGDIKGESIDDKHKDSIEIESWSWGLSQSGSASTGGGGGAGKVSLQDFHFTKNTDRSTPPLMLACCQGKHFKEAVLTARKAGGKVEDYLQVTFSDLLVSSYSDKPPPVVEGTDANGAPLPVDNEPMESLSLNFAKIEFEYMFLNSEGVTETSRFGWDVAANKKF